MNKKKNQYITFLVIPGSAAVTRKLTLSTRIFKLLILLVGVLVILISFMAYNYWTSRQDLANARKIMEQAKKKDEDIQKLTQKVLELEQQNLRISQQQDQLKKLVGGASSYQNQPSRSGVGLNRVSEETLEELDSRAQLLGLILDAKEAETQQMFDLALSRASLYRSVPNLWPVNGEITSSYGWRKSPFKRSKKRTEFHDGIDIAVPYGASVRAAGDGVVVYSGWLPAYGRSIKVRHSNGLITLYGHNSKLLVKEGDLVKKGQIISEVGSSGRSTGPHLHFGIEKNGKILDPMLYLP